MVWGSTTTSVSIPKAGASELQARDTLQSLGTRGLGQLGNLSDLASGKLQINPEDEALVRRIQELTGEAARQQMQSNYELVSSQVEGQLLEGGLSKSSIEAVKQALLGKDLQSSLNQSALQGQITGAQQLREGMYQNAGIKMSANQLLLNQILGGAGAVAQMGLQERLAQPTTKQSGGGLGGLVDMASLAGLGLGSLIPKKNAAAGTTPVTAPPVSTLPMGSYGSITLPNQSVPQF